MSDTELKEGAPDRFHGTVLCVALALLAWPFHGDWLDYESARRGLLGSIGGVIVLLIATRAATRGFSGWRRIHTLGWLYVGFVVMGGDSDLGSTARVNHWLALGAIGWLSRTQQRAGAPDRIASFVPWLSIPVLLLIFAQRFGLEWPLGAGPADPVGTLGNRGVAGEWLVLVLFAWATRTSTARTPFDWVGIAGTAVAIGLCDNRNAVVATGVGVVALAGIGHWSRPGQASPSVLQRVITPLVIVGSLGLGALTSATDPTTSVDPTAPEAATSPSTMIGGATAEVRLEIWKSSLQLVEDSPLSGHGAGTFRSLYPTVRSEREIELSSFGRTLPTEVQTAHNDALEVLIEAGVLGLVLASLVLLGLFRSSLRSRSAQGVVLIAVMLALSLFRSPFLSAPTAALFTALVVAGQRPRSASIHDVDTEGGMGRLQRILFAVLLALPGLAMLHGGVRKFVGSIAAADYRTDGEATTLDAAIRWDPQEPSYRLMRIARVAGVNENNLLDRVTQDLRNKLASDLERLEDHAPDHPLRLLWQAQIEQAAGNRNRALALLDRQLTNDTEDPIAQQLEAILLVETGRTEEALERVVLQTAPTLRPTLGSLLGQLAEIPLIPDRDHQQLNSLGALATALRQIQESATAGDTALQAAESTLSDLQRRLGRRAPTVQLGRGYLLLRRGQQNFAEAMAPREPLSFDRFERQLARDAIDAMRQVPGWEAALPDLDRNQSEDPDASDTNPR